MALLIKTGKTLRNNWKKSTFFAALLAWGGSYTKHKIDTENLMRAYCEQAAQIGKQTIPVTVNPRHITVILNPNANKRKAQAEFEKYCVPLLHLAGVTVEIVKTESEGHAKDLIETLQGAEAVVVAGGDGTLSEVVTGLLRRTNENVNGLVPIGILPLGRSNMVGGSLFPGETKLEKVKSLAEATMAIIEEVTKHMDVMRIEILDDQSKKPVYAVGGLKLGAYRDAEVKKEKYWYFGGLKKYATYLLNGLKSSLAWNCQAELLYSPPCSGCSNCSTPQSSQPKSKWFQSFMKEEEQVLKMRNILNPNCSAKLEKDIVTSDLMLYTSNVLPDRIQSTTEPKLSLFIGPEKVSYMDFVKQGWKSEKGKMRDFKELVEARTVEFKPKVQNRDLWFSIDNEDYEVKPIRVTLLPNILIMYCRKSSNQNYR